MNLELVSAFLKHETTDRIELMLKDGIEQLDKDLAALEKERQELSAKLNEVQQKLLKMSGAFESQLEMAEKIAVEKDLKPLKPQQKAT